MKNNNVSFFSSITIKVTIALMISFILIIGLVFYIVQNEGYDNIREESSQIVVETGKLTSSYISADLRRIEKNASQIRNNSEVLPLQQQLFHLLLGNLFTEDSNSDELVSASILPNAALKDYFYPIQIYKHNKVTVDSTEQKSINMMMADKATYTDTAWYKLVKNTRPTTCLWSHLQFDADSEERTLNCSQAIMRNNEFWGISNVTVNANIFNEALEALNNEFNESYAILIDNSNQIISSSDPVKLPIINQQTKKPYLLEEYIEKNPAWESISERLAIQHNSIVVAHNLTSPEVITEHLNLVDTMQEKTASSMVLNHNASQARLASLTEGNYLGSVDLEEDSYLSQDSQAHLFSIPETNWSLVVVQSEGKLGAVADNLSKNLIKYIMFSLILMLAIIFFMLDSLALRPMERTLKRILQADKFINNNQYHRLSEISFKNIKQDEMGIVNNSLKKLLQRIEDNEGKLASVNQQLEIKVGERTAELRNTMNDLKTSQIQLIRSEKMATLGQMVAGVAHEVNTPLTYVQNNIEIIGQLAEQYEELTQMIVELKNSMSDETTPEVDIEQLMHKIIDLVDELEEDEISSELRDLIKDSLFGVEQIAEMVLNLRNFARIDETKVKRTDVRECVSTSLKIAQNSIKHYQVNIDLPEIPEIICSPPQINQVIINLLNNASQAIGQRPNGQIDISVKSDDRYVTIIIKDSGAGMSRKVQERIFEPFFTTKAAGEGTGLGMAISQQIIDQHNGEIQVSSTEGVGTEFRLLLPIDGVNE